MTDNFSELAGGVAVITGAGSGIGAGIARAAAQAGMTVVLADIAADRAAAMAAAIEADGGTALAFACDVTRAGDLDDLAKRTVETFGNVRLLVNNAGIEVLGNIWDVSAETWSKAFNINVLGVVNGVRAFVPGMLASGEHAFIANLSSVGGLGLMPGQTPYMVSKHAVLAFTESLALEIQVTGKPISVSAVLPGPIATPIFDRAPSADTPASVEPHRAHMQAVLKDQGMDSDTAGQLILAGIAARRFWVSTHPAMMADMARARGAYLGGLAEPMLTPEMCAILGK